MTTYTITFIRNDDTHQTVKVQDVDRIAAQMTVLCRYAGVKQIVCVK